MTKEQLIKENKRYREALEDIIDALDPEGETFQRAIECYGFDARYPYAAGAADMIAKLALSGERA